MIKKNQPFLIFSLIFSLLSTLFSLACEAQIKYNDNAGDSSIRSSITLILQSKQSLQLVSNSEDLILFENNADTVKKVTQWFSVNKVKELRTLNAALSQPLLLFSNSHPEFTVINNKLIAHNSSAKQAILPDDISHIGRIYCLLTCNKYGKLDTASSAAFLNNRKKELSEDIIKIKQRVNSGEWDARTGEYWQLLLEFTDASIIFNVINNTWLNIHRKDIYEHYYAKLSEICQISGPSATFATFSLASYWGEINKVDSSLSWVDFYLQNKALIGKEIIDLEFYNVVKNITDGYKMNQQDKKDLQKIMLYAKANDLVLYDLITKRKERLILDLQNILLQDKTGSFQNLESILSKTHKKYILIDFWASWCAPCREALPFIKKIIPELYKNDITVISISIDQQFNAWQMAMTQESLKQDVFQFRLVNSKTKPHTLNNIFDLSRIPRYAVITKNGKVLIRETNYFPREKEFKGEIIGSTK